MVLLLGLVLNELMLDPGCGDPDTAVRLLFQNLFFSTANAVIMDTQPAQLALFSKS